MTFNKDTKEIKERFCEGYGLDTGLFHLGYALIQMRCHVWSIAPTVQSRMRKQWQHFASMLSKRGVISSSKLDSEVITWAIKQNFKKIETHARNAEQASKQKKELVFTINNVFSGIPLLQWTPIALHQNGDVSLVWTRPEKPEISEFDKHSQSQKMAWLGRCMAVVNSGAASSLKNLGGEIYAHCYRGELSHAWISTYKKAWSAFMKWCPYETTDQLTHEDITNFALWLLARADDQAEPMPVEVCVFALNMVNDGLARLRGEHWQRVEQPFTTEEVAQVPHPAQIAIKSIAAAEAHKTTVPISKSNLSSEHVRDDARMNYFLGSSMLIVGQRIIKLRSDKSKSDVHSLSSSNRSRNWHVFCSFMSAKGIRNLSQLNSDLISDYIEEQRNQLTIGAIKEFALRARIAHPLAIISSILPLNFEQNKHFADNNCISPWAAPITADGSPVPKDISKPEFFESKIANFGFGNGLIAPAYQILITNDDFKITHQQKESCAVTFGVYLKDAGLKQLQEVSCTIADDFFDQLEDRIDDGLTSRAYALQVAEAVNIIMLTMQDDWTPRAIEARAAANKIDPMKTSTEISMERANQKKRNPWQRT